MKTQTRRLTRSKSATAALHPLDNDLRDRVQVLTYLADVGQLDAPAAVLAILFALAVPHLDGEHREKALRLRTWYEKEAKCS